MYHIGMDYWEYYESQLNIADDYKRETEIIDGYGYEYPYKGRLILPKQYQSFVKFSEQHSTDIPWRYISSIRLNDALYSRYYMEV